MQTQAKITVANDTFEVVSPYSVSNNENFKSVGGKYRDSKWVLPNNPQVEGMLKDMFGLSDTIVEVHISDLDSGYQTLKVGGYVICSRRGRDEQVQMMPGTYLVAGTLPRSGGSIKNPSVSQPRDAVFSVIVRKDFAEDSGLLIVEEAGKTKAELEAEKAVLLKKLDEIEEQLTAMA